MVLLPTLFFFILGLIIGSFLNVVIYRLGTARSLGGRSACMSCEKKLLWHELIPLFSFVGLRGRCRNCKTKISVQYPLVEMLTGFIFAFLFFKFQYVFFSSPSVFAITFAYCATIFSLLLVITVYDIKHKIIPDVLSIVLGILSFVGLFFFSVDGSFGVPIFHFHIPTLFGFLSGAFVAIPFYLFWLLSNGRWMGLGDAKLALGLGWFLGLSLSLSAIVVAFWSGALVGVALIVLLKNRKTGRMGMKSEIPFAPFLVFGTLVAFFFNLNLFGI